MCLPMAVWMCGCSAPDYDGPVGIERMEYGTIKPGEEPKKETTGTDTTGAAAGKAPTANEGKEGEKE